MIERYLGIDVVAVDVDQMVSSKSPCRLCVYEKIVCSGIPCKPSNRDDGRDVIFERANKQPEPATAESNGSSADYYDLPEGATRLQDLISFRNMNAQDGEIFRAIYRKGHCPHSSLLREAKKVLFYAQAEVDRLEKLG